MKNHEIVSLVRQWGREYDKCVLEEIIPSAVSGYIRSWTIPEDIELQDSSKITRFIDNAEKSLRSKFDNAYVSIVNPYSNLFYFKIVLNT
jgi:hypothetical protein